jgi:hypothetical protein
MGAFFLFPGGAGQFGEGERGRQRGGGSRGGGGGGGEKRARPPPAGATVSGSHPQRAGAFVGGKSPPVKIRGPFYLGGRGADGLGLGGGGRGGRNGGGGGGGRGGGGGGTWKKKGRGTQNGRFVSGGGGRPFCRTPFLSPGGPPKPPASKKGRAKGGFRGGPHAQPVIFLGGGLGGGGCSFVRGKAPTLAGRTHVLGQLGGDFFFKFTGKKTIFPLPRLAGEGYEGPVGPRQGFSRLAVFELFRPCFFLRGPGGDFEGNARFDLRSPRGGGGTTGGGPFFLTQVLVRYSVLLSCFTGGAARGGNGGRGLVWGGGPAGLGFFGKKVQTPRRGGRGRRGGGGTTTTATPTSEVGVGGKGGGGPPAPTGFF